MSLPQIRGFNYGAATRRRLMCNDGRAVGFPALHDHINAAAIDRQNNVK
jgi:hypothetical protein